MSAQPTYRPRSTERAALERQLELARLRLALSRGRRAREYVMAEIDDLDRKLAAIGQ